MVAAWTSLEDIRCQPPGRGHNEGRKGVLRSYLSGRLHPAKLEAKIQAGTRGLTSMSHICTREEEGHRVHTITFKESQADVNKLLVKSTKLAARGGRLGLQGMWGVTAGSHLPIGVLNGLYLAASCPMLLPHKIPKCELKRGITRLQLAGPHLAVGRKSVGKSVVRLAGKNLLVIRGSGRKGGREGARVCRNGARRSIPTW